MAQNYGVDIQRWNGQDYDTILPTPDAHADTHKADGSDPLTLQAGNYGALSIPTSAYQNASITRAKLAKDALYSPIELFTKDKAIKAEDAGKTFRTGGTGTEGLKLTLTQSVSATMSPGAEIAFFIWSGTYGQLVFDGVKVAIAGNAAPITSPTLRIEKYGMVAIKKVLAEPAGDMWLLTGNAEVIS